MKAVVFADTRSVQVDEVSNAMVEEPSDVVVHVTSSAICGTDLHMYDGRTGATAGLVLGHEPLGVVEQVGSAVELVKTGDRVVIPTHLYCGVCVNCARGYSAARLRVRPGGVRRRLRLRRDGSLPRSTGRTAAGAIRRRQLYPDARRPRRRS
jgi:glutathione-independent formaldehyde dehydrogenase